MENTDGVIKQIPLTKPGNICPICRQKVTQKITTQVALYSNENKAIIRYCDLFYCSTCHLPLVSAEMCTTIRRGNNGYSINGLAVSGSFDLINIRKKMYDNPYPRKTTKIHSKKNDIKNNDNNASADKLKMREVAQKKVKPDIQEDDRKTPIYELRATLEDHGSAIVALCVKYENNAIENWLIVNDPKDDSIGKGNVLYYTSEDARELLTGAFARERKGNAYSGTFHGKKYNIICRLSASKYSQNDIFPVTLYIKPHKKKQTAEERLAEKSVIVLLYSPFTKRYERIRATLVDDELSVNITGFRDFVSKYGNPGIELEPHMDHSRDNSSRWDELREESFFKAYGYTVDAKVGMYKDKRRELLTEIIDLKLRTKNQTIDHIQYCISSHPGEKYEDARFKWKSDIEYLETYNPNPSRFYIVGNIVKK